MSNAKGNAISLNLDNNFSCCGVRNRLVILYKRTRRRMKLGNSP